MTRRRTPAWTLVGSLVATMAVMGACSAAPRSGSDGSPATSAPAPAASSGTTTSAASSCVADPAAVAIAQPVATPQPDLPPEQVAKLDAAVRSALTSATPGVVVGVSTPQGVWREAYGKADVKTGARMTVGTHTRIGSVTKMFTVSVVLRLAQDKRLSLDDPIEKYVPDVPNGDRISLRQLASMTSGVASYTRDETFVNRYFAHPETVLTPAELVKAGTAKSPLFEPGAEFDYSNTNTVLLGLVIEKVTGAPVEDAITNDVFEPLGLAQTSWPGTSTALPEPYADGYTLQGDRATPDEPSNATHWNPAWAWTAGEVVSTVDDLLTFGRAVGTGQGLLEPPTQTERLTSFPGEAGYGLGIGCIGGWVGHSGELPGYNTTVYHDTTSGTTVVVQVNSDIASGNCEESPTLTDDPKDKACSSPATRVFVALSTALGHTFDAIPAR